MSKDINDWVLDEWGTYMRWTESELADSRDALFKNGFIHIKNFLSKSYLQDLALAVDWVEQHPSPFRIDKTDGINRFFMDFGNWRRSDLIKKLCLHQPLAELTASLIRSKTLRLMHEDIIIKNGTNDNATPPHQDQAYFIFGGDRNISAWMSLNDVPNNSSLLMYRGSHLSKQSYRPKRFDSGQDMYGDADREESTYVATVLDEINIFEEVSFDYQVGDIILFFNKTLHASRLNLIGAKRKSFVIRYLSDDAYIEDNPFATVPPYELMGVNLSERNIIPEKFFPNILEEK